MLNLFCRALSDSLFTILSISSIHFPLQFSNNIVNVYPVFCEKCIKSLCVSLCRYALNEMDKFSLKDSGRGDSEAGDSDYEPGRESPMDRLLGEGFTEIYAPDGQHRTHAGTPLAPPSPHPTNLPAHPIMPLSLPLPCLQCFSS